MTGRGGVVFVLFGATGSLAARKILPALFNLKLDGQLPEPFVLLGLGRRPLDDGVLAAHYREAVGRHSRRGEPAQADWDAFAVALRYLSFDVQEPQDYARLAELLESQARAWNTLPDVVFYLAVPPSLFATAVQYLAAQGLHRERARVRVVVEKPLGYDLESFLAINAELCRHFHEGQIFRIDHFLGKETVQNVLALRFANPIFEPIWNRNYVDHVAITVAEREGIGERGGYYERTGALRDMVQNHLIQLLCLTAMEPPVSYAPEEIRSRKMDVMNALRRIEPHTIHQVAARGQYRGGWLGGDRVQAYREEQDVAPGSHTETFAAVRAFVDNWRWQGVPFYLRSGKRLAADLSEIAIRFRSVPHCFFPGCVGLNAAPAQLVVRIKPDQGVRLHFAAKEPGYCMCLKPVQMRFNYREAFGTDVPAAYETLLRDLMEGDPTLFMRADQVEAAWRWLMPLVDFWTHNPPPDFPNYNPGTWGPEAADLLVAADGRAWLSPGEVG
ncbi:MAG: glucose-6-phosphate dehydrogenase [Thiohalomonadaceae bacterium]